jgi:DNA-binding NarL/FixJ family response regulator
MEFKREELIEREIEIAGYLMQGVSLKHIAETTGLSKRLLATHIKNMMEKLKAEDMSTLIKLLKAKFNQP